MDLPHTLDYYLGVSIVADWSMNYFSAKRSYSAANKKSKKEKYYKKVYIVSVA